MINSVFRAYRYDESYSAFAGHTLTPGATVAGRTTVANPYAGRAHYDALQRETETQYWDATNAYNGYTFFGAQGTSYLIDMQGRVAHTWATAATLACWRTAMCWIGPATAAATRGSWNSTGTATQSGSTSKPAPHTTPWRLPANL